MGSDQIGFFDEPYESIELEGASVALYRRFFDLPTSNHYFESLHAETPWKVEKTILFGKLVPVPRLTAWYGDHDAEYTYSGIELSPIPWSPLLLDIKDYLSNFFEFNINSALLNLYRDGQDSVSWHADDEPELGTQPTIISISLGEKRRFRLRRKNSESDEERVSIDLSHGDLLLMKGRTQQNWEHSLPKTSRDIGPRINVTFRQVFQNESNKLATN